jgi:transcriptional regulator with XRE-family HTH domain
MQVHGPALRAIRERTGLTVTELAKRVGITQGSLSAIEKEARKPSSEVLVKLARELRVDLAAILRDQLENYDITITHKDRGDA